MAFLKSKEERAAAKEVSDDSRVLRMCRAFLAHRKAVVLLFFALALVCAACIPQVKVNYAMTDYLPDDAASVQALDDMESAFDGAIPNTRAYVEGIDLATADELSQTLADLDGVEEVMWLGSNVDTHQPLETLDTDTVETWKTDTGYLYQIAIDTAKGKQVVPAIREACDATGAENVTLAGDAVTTASAQESTGTEVAHILLMGVLIIAVILLLTSTSWLEPVIFLTVIGIAIAMNMGTNLVRGEISFISQICGAILQLAVSMDYAIVLLHTFRRCQREYDDPMEAMARAMVKGFSVILSSAAVTFFGFLSLTVMRFGIGVDMGIVLAKGIVFSFLTIMFFMPCFIMLCLRPLNKLEHKPLVTSESLDGLARVCQHLMIPCAIIVVIVAVPCFMGEGRTNFIYGSSEFASPDSEIGQEKTYMEEAFGKSQTWVVMVPEGQWSNEQALIDDLDAFDQVTGVTSYITVAGRAMPVGVVPEDTLSQVVSNGWSRIVVTLDTDTDGDETFALVEQVRDTCAQHYGDDYRLVGSSVSTYDLSVICHEDSTRVQLFSILAIGLVLALMFRSISLPFIILLAIEVSIWMNLAVPYFMGESLNYIGYLVIEAVQLGAAVDYAIIYAREYFDRREQYLPSEAARSAIKHGGLTILTSSSILFCAGMAVWIISSNGVISEIGLLIGRGAALAMLMMFVFLPCLFRVFDGLICKTTMGLKGHIALTSNPLPPTKG